MGEKGEGRREGKSWVEKMDGRKGMIKRRRNRMKMKMMAENTVHEGENRKGG